MSETTKRALNADLIDLSIPWCKRIDRTHLIAAPVANTPPRPSRLAAEGGVGNFTPTRSGNVGTASEAQTSRAVEECGCDRCQSSRPGFPGPSKPGWRYACEQCGNKRCPHHEWHGFECTSSNEPEQVGIEAKPDEATNSLPENGTACTGRKTALVRMSFCAVMIAFLLLCIWIIGGVWAAFDAIGVAVWANLFRLDALLVGRGFDGAKIAGKAQLREARGGIPGGMENRIYCPNDERSSWNDAATKLLHTANPGSSAFGESLQEGCG